MSLYEQYSIEHKEVALCRGELELEAIVVYVVFVAEMEKVFLSGKVSFCRLGSLRSGNFTSNSTSKMCETNSALGWECVQHHSVESPLGEEGNQHCGLSG